MLNGLSTRKLKRLIEERFVDDMSWKNYGLRWIIRLNEKNDIRILQLKKNR